MDSSPLQAREKKTPTWAVLAPVVYLLACGLAARAVFATHDDSAGVPGMLAAVGLLPAFVIPAVFTTSRVRLSITDAGLAIAGTLASRVVKVDDVRLEHAARGGGVLHVTVRSGETLTFLVSSHREAQQLLVGLPPASAPAGALAA